MDTPVTIPEAFGRARTSRRRGFALIVTIVLVAFLVLLLVGLATFTRVETQVASNSQDIAGARQNALMALNVALGQLQKYAGPDQRVTTTADLLADQDKAGVAVPAPLHATTARTAISDGARFWTAVWGNTESNISYSLNPDQIPPTAGNRRGVTPGLLNWLVSGNESVTFSANGTAGGVTPGPVAPVFTPSQAIDLTNLASPTINSRRAVVLVGANSVGNTAAARKDFVTAPLVDVQAPASAIPGADPTSAVPITVGRYAWWVGDEGVKARVDLQNGYQQTGAAADQINSFLVAQRSAVEFVDIDPAGTGSPTRIGTDYDFTSSAIPRLLGMNQLPFINAAPAAQTRLSTATKNRFHDLTTQGFGVLSDTYAGGLKKDLTADIADTSNNVSYRPADTDPVFTPLSNSEANLPTWGLIRSWARTNPANPGDPVAPSLPSATNAGFYPTISYFSLGFDYIVDSVTGRIRFLFFPYVSLHNPYPVPIDAADYDLGVYWDPQDQTTPQFTVQFKPSTAGVYTDRATFNLNTLEFLPVGGAGTAPNTYLKFKINGTRINPGQRLIYLLPDSLHNSVYNAGSPPTLELGDASGGGLGETNYVSVEGPVLDLTGAVANEERIRMTINLGNARKLRTSVMLAEDGALSGSSWDPTTSRAYQNFHSIFPYVHNVPFDAGTGATSYCVRTPTAVATENTLAEKRLSIKATSSTRLVAPFEGEGLFSSHARAGLLQNRISRFTANASVRAPINIATAMENSDPQPGGVPRFAEQSVGAGPFGIGIFSSDQMGGLDPHPFARYSGNTTGFGYSPDIPPGSDPGFAIFWDILDSEDRLLSLGQLQHVPFGRYGFQPSYLFGNSYADMRVRRDALYRAGKVKRLANATMDPIYDASWHLNRALWDKHFVSGVPSTLTAAQVTANAPLPNARLTYFHGDGPAPDLAAIRYTGGANRAYNEAAANLVVAGAFNINSTSEQAWRAILASTYRIPLNSDYANAGDAVTTAIPYPRFTHNLAQAAEGAYPARPITMKPDPAFNSTDTVAVGGPKIRNTLYFGNRGLFLNSDITENPTAERVVAELARSIVEEIRFRGPFLSLADFINRPLTSPAGVSTSPARLAGIKGALQAGIDNMDPSGPAGAQVNPITLTQKTFSALRIGQEAPARYDWDDEHSVGGLISGNSSALTTQQADQAYRAAFAMTPKHITQADLLTTLGPLLSARSDTFTIRAYGEKVNPTDSTQIQGRAWCEAVVQRLPEYVAPSATQTPTAAPTGTNITFGRRFRVVSFRWLNNEDI